MGKKGGEAEAAEVTGDSEDAGGPGRSTDETGEEGFAVEEVLKKEKKTIYKDSKLGSIVQQFASKSKKVVKPAVRK